MLCLPVMFKKLLQELGSWEKCLHHRKELIKYIFCSVGKALISWHWAEKEAKKYIFSLFEQ